VTYNYRKKAMFSFNPQQDELQTTTTAERNVRKSEQSTQLKFKFSIKLTRSVSGRKSRWLFAFRTTSLFVGGGILPALSAFIATEMKTHGTLLDRVFWTFGQEIDRCTSREMVTTVRETLPREAKLWYE